MSCAANKASSKRCFAWFVGVTGFICFVGYLYLLSPTPPFFFGSGGVLLVCSSCFLLRHPIIIAARQVRMESTLVRGCMRGKGNAKVCQKGFCVEMRSSYYIHIVPLCAFQSGRACRRPRLDAYL